MATTMPPVFDEQEFLDRVGRDYELAADVARLFLEDCPRRLAVMRGALAVGDAVALRTEAHGLKGAAGNMSANQLSAAACELEDHASQQRLDLAVAALDRVEDEAGVVLDAVRAFETVVAAR